MITLAGCDSGTDHKREKVRVEAEADDARVRIPGSRISLRPEGDFSLHPVARTIISAEDSNAFLTVSELLWSYKDMRASVNGMDFRTLGISANSVKDTTIAGREAVQIIGTQPGADSGLFGKLAYIIKLDTGSVMVLGNYPATRPELLPMLKRMVGSLDVEPVNEFVLIEELDFGIDTVGTGFRYKLNQKGGRQFTLIPYGLAVPGLEPDCYFWVVEIKSDYMDVKERRAYFQREMGTQCQHYGADPIRINSVTIAGMPGFQAECQGPGKGGRPEELLITQLYGDKVVYLLMGRTNYDHKPMLARFKDLSTKFYRKNVRVE